MLLNKFTKTASLLFLLIGSSAAWAEAGTKADWTTTLQVKLALLDKLGTDSLHVEVDSNSGAVTLEGVVQKRETRELAETVAKSVKGVQSVQNDLTLAASDANTNKAEVVAGEAEAEVKDAILSTKVRIALVNKMGGDGFKIGTEAANGVVTLRFDPEMTVTRRREATKLVIGIAGVSKVLSLQKKT